MAKLFDYALTVVVAGRTVNIYLEVRSKMVAQAKNETPTCMCPRCSEVGKENNQATGVVKRQTRPTSILAFWVGSLGVMLLCSLFLMVLVVASTFLNLYMGLELSGLEASSRLINP